MIHDLPIRCYPQLGTQTNLIYKKRYHIPFYFSWRENLSIWPLHQNEPMSATDTFMISFDFSRLLSFILMLWTDVGTLGESHICIGKWCGHLICSVESILLRSSIYYTHFRRIHSTSTLYYPLIPSCQPYHPPKSKVEHHCFDDHHLEWYLTWLSDPPCFSWYLLKHKKRIILVGEIQEETADHDIHNNSLFLVGRSVSPLLWVTL